MEAFRLNSRVRPPVGSVWRTAPVEEVEPAREVLAAQPVPWRVVSRGGSGSIEIEHRGSGPLRAVRFMLAGGGMLGLSLPRTMHPGERLRVVLRGVYADGAVTAPDAMLVLRWFQPDGTELLWPIAL